MYWTFAGSPLPWDPICQDACFISVTDAVLLLVQTQHTSKYTDLFAKAVFCILRYIYDDLSNYRIMINLIIMHNCTIIIVAA